jgi:hypothetical protein
MSNAKSRLVGAVTGTGITRTCLSCASCKVGARQLARGGGVMGLRNPQLSPQAWSPSSSSHAGPPNNLSK